MAIWTRSRRIASPNAGGCDFVSASEALTTTAREGVWTPEALPSVVRLSAPPSVKPRHHNPQDAPPADASQAGDWMFRCNGETFRFFVSGEPDTPATAMLPFDDLLDLRATAATRLRRALLGKSVARNPAALTPDRQARLILALRALDARKTRATNRQIAAGLFPHIRVPAGAWISHDLRDRTARLVRLGLHLSRDGYRQLLLYPYRGKGIG